MAKASFFCLPGHGHVNPTLPLVAELVKRGEHIDYWTGAEFRAAVAKTGATFRPLPAALDQIASLDTRFGLFALAEYLAAATLESLPELKRALEADRPDYVIHDSMTTFGKLTAQLLRLPRVVTFPSFGVVPDRVPLPPLPLLMLFTGPRLLPQTIRRHRRRKALAKEISRTFGVEELKFGNLIANPSDCNIVFTSERFQLSGKRPDDRFHFVGPCIAERLPDPSFPLDALHGRRVIYISLGTVFNDRPQFFKGCIEAFRDSRDLVVMSVGKRIDVGSLGPIPPHFIVRNQVPQLDVLKRAAAFITHGGMNSVSEGLFHDVPLLVFPQAADQFLIAGRVAELRCGRRLHARDLEPQRLRQLTEAVMDDVQIKKNVELIGVSLRDAGGVRRAADIVLASRGARLN